MLKKNLEVKNVECLIFWSNTRKKISIIETNWAWKFCWLEFPNENWQIVPEPGLHNFFSSHILRGEEFNFDVGHMVWGYV
jgi:hypothetical protein